MPTLITTAAARSAFAKYRSENLEDTSTTLDVFSKWLVADLGAYEFYVNNNSAAHIEKSLEAFKGEMGLANSFGSMRNLKPASSISRFDALDGRSAITELSSLKRENVFQKSLRDTSILLRNHGASKKSIFISYAWEDSSTNEGVAANKALQEWLHKLSTDLAVIGIRVFLDIENMSGKLSDWMIDNIQQSDYVILVGTPRYKERAVAETNVALEFKEILTKVAKDPGQGVLLPILYSGDFRTSFPNEVMNYFIRDCRNPTNYYQMLLGLLNPLGIVPNIYPDLEKGGKYHEEYMWLFELFSNQIKLLEAELRNINNNLPNISDNLPAASPYFVGRVKEMDALQRQFNQPGYMSMAIVGMGGSGKSQLAAEFAHKSKLSEKSYNLIRWLKADSEDTLKKSYFSLGADFGLKIDDFNGSEEAFKRGIDYQLSRYGNILLIYDNVEDLDYVAKYQPSASGKSRVHTLITTRIRFVDRASIEVGEFNAQEVQTYLNKRLQKETPIELAEQLGKELGYLPLAIVQAGAYMVKFGKTIETFLQLLQTSVRERVLELEADHKTKTISMLWNMTLSKLSSGALETIRLCALLDPDYVPRCLLERFIGLEHADQILYELRSQSLLTDSDMERGLFRMHRLLQEVVRKQFARDDADNVQTTAIIDRAIEAFKAIIGDKTIIGDDGLRYTPSVEKYLFWKEYDYLALQIGYLIREADKLKIDIKSQAILCTWAGEYQDTTLNLKECLYMHLKALELRKNINSGNDAEIANCLASVASAYCALAQYDKELEYIEQALGMYKAVYGEDHAFVAISLNALGGNYNERGKYKKALKYYQDALELRKKFNDGKHPFVAIILDNIGDIYGDHKYFKLKRALACYEEALEIRKAIYGENHPEIVVSLLNVGSVYNYLMYLETAKRYYSKALEITMAYYGEKRPETANPLHYLSMAYKMEFLRFGKAIKYEKQALAIYKDTYGDKHPALINTMVGLADDILLRAQLISAFNYNLKALNIAKSVYGANHSKTREIKALVAGDVFIMCVYPLLVAVIPLTIGVALPTFRAVQVTRAQFVLDKEHKKRRTLLFSSAATGHKTLEDAKKLIQAGKGMTSLSSGNKEIAPREQRVKGEAEASIGKQKADSKKCHIM